jgi:hypothetical protein
MHLASEPDVASLESCKKVSSYIAWFVLIGIIVSTLQVGWFVLIGIIVSTLQVGIGRFCIQG